MARGVRSNPVLLPTFSQGQQPQSLASYDPRTRRNTILIAEIVPTLKEGTVADLGSPADRYYSHIGAAQSASYVAAWWGGAALNVSFGNWDATSKKQYARFSSTAASSFLGGSGVPKFIYPAGPFGTASSFAPKNATATAVWIRFSARFNANSDYGTRGIGATNGTVGNFATATDHFVQVLRNAGSWELGTCDGATISQASGGSADGSWHEFGIRWVDGEMKLYVDDELTITKTTNLPTRPLYGSIGAVDDTTSFDVEDYLVEWEVG